MRIYVLMYVCMHVQFYACIYMYVCMYAYVCMHKCTLRHRMHYMHAYIEPLPFLKKKFFGLQDPKYKYDNVTGLFSSFEIEAKRLYKRIIISVYIYI